MTQKPFKKINLKVPELDAATISRGYNIVLEELKAGKKTFGQLLNPLSVLYEDCECMTRAALVYSVLHSMKKQDMITVETELAEAIFEGIDVPKFVISLKDVQNK